MNKILLSIAVTAGFASSAIAADLPVKARPMAPAPVIATNWSGCYIGAGGGYGMYNQNTSTRYFTTAAPTVLSESASITNGGEGWFGTVQVGCDYQFAQRWVVGVFGDYTFSDLKGDYTFPNNGPQFVGQEKMKDSWAVGARVGYLVLPQLLAFVSGGYTEARFSDITLANAFTGTPAINYLGGQTHQGWFIGTGYEYALDFLPGLFWKTEYRYSQYEAKDYPFLSVAGNVPTGEYTRNDKSTHMVRSELVWRFNFGGGPVVARY